MSKFIVFLPIVLAIALSGCATAGKSTLLGGAIGSTVGASLGILASQHDSPTQRTQGALIGAGIGGLLGALIGNESYKSQAKKDEAKALSADATRLEMFGAASEKTKRPTLKPAQVKVRYVEDQIKDGTFIPAHFEYEISEPAKWERSK